MRDVEELERVAFREKLTADEDSLLAGRFMGRTNSERDSRRRIGPLKQAAFFASRAFDKGARDPESLSRFVPILAEVQKVAPTDSFRRKLAEMRSAQKGKNAFEAVLKKLSRVGEAGSKKVLATDGQLDGIESALGVKLPKSYRAYLKQYAHRSVGTYEPFIAAEIVDAVRMARQVDVPDHLLPFLYDNGDYFCFDLRSTVEEPAVVFWDHNGRSDETWPNFAAWVEECWLGELDD